ncbi:zinc-finger-containing protein [Cupriavidus necator]|uniref:zinc-finger-containing protein n=1 Tax=Cupriavidus necator TaxID=106590 RepID=UPI003ECEDD3E
MTTVSVIFYAIVSQRFTSSGYATGKPTVRVTKSKPDCSATEVPVRIAMKLPESLFKRPILQANIVVPEGESQFQITTEIEEGIAQLVQEGMGITMRITSRRWAMTSAAKTPWNPSRRATARVKNPLPAPTHCPYCSAPVDVVSNAEIYGREYGDWPWAYRCTSKNCHAYVELPPFTNIPLGTLADAPTREARKRAKAVFNPLWQSERMTRDEAYVWLAGALSIANSEECHIGWFDVQTCQRVVTVCLHYAREQNQ